MLQWHRNFEVRIDPEIALHAFESLGKSPYHFRGLVEQTVLRPDRPFAEALSDYRERLAETQGYETRWSRLKPLQRALLIVLASDHPRPFGTAAAALIEAETGKRVGKSGIQRSLGSLAADGVIDRWDGAWRFADDEFRIWTSGALEGRESSGT